MSLLWGYSCLLALSCFHGIDRGDNSFFNTPFTVLLQQKIEGDYLGRIFGVFTMISSAAMPLGMLVFGPVADIVQIEWLLIGTGILLFAESFFLLGSRELIKAGKPVLEIH